MEHFKFPPQNKKRWVPLMVPKLEPNSSSWCVSVWEKEDLELKTWSLPVPGRGAGGRKVSLQLYSKNSAFKKRSIKIWFKEKKTRTIKSRLKNGQREWKKMRYQKQQEVWKWFAIFFFFHFGMHAARPAQCQSRHSARAAWRLGWFSLPTSSFFKFETRISPSTCGRR